MQDYEQIRQELEEKGYKLSDAEFASMVEYARRKAKVAGKDESYLSLLLPDVIEEYYFRMFINAVSSLRMMEGSNI
ncbi:MAG: hypothetical protein Q4C77_02735 [Eubacteriales bacterium]|nr:hypothetical protein [Eubacteriales bacterium]